MSTFLQINPLSNGWIEVIHNDVAPITLAKTALLAIGPGARIVQAYNLDVVTLYYRDGSIQLITPSQAGTIANAIPVSTINGSTIVTIDDLYAGLKAIVQLP